MKKKFALPAAALGLAGLFAGLAPASATDGNAGAPSASIAGLVAASGGEFDDNGGDFDMLLGAVSAAGLVEALDTTPDLSVLAPTDSAFIQTARDLGYAGDDEAGAFGFLVDVFTTLGGGDPIPPLTNVLLYHVVPGAPTAGAAISGELNTLLGAPIADVGGLAFGDAEPDLPDPALIASAVNIAATNGFVHAIDRVLLPLDTPASAPAPAPEKGDSGATILDIALTSGGEFDNNLGDYDILVQAVVAADLGGALGDMDAELTVFAPDDRAFVRLANDLGYEGHDEAEAFGAIVEALTALGGGDPIPVLQAVLLYHVAPGALSVSDVISGDSVTTALEGATIRPFRSFVLIDNDPDIRNPRLRLRKSNIHASNGVVHTIDRVLIPLDI